MFKNNQFLSSRRIFTFTIAAVIGFLLSNHMGYGLPQISESKHVVLKGSISLEAVKVLPELEKGKIQPGTGIKLSVDITNEGQQSSEPGELFIRYAFAEPLEKEPGSLIFQTEKKPLPSIEPGKQIIISFDTVHTTSSVSDFVRNDWQLREYQAVALIDKEEYVIGTLALTFSSYYYPGIKKELPSKINNQK